MRAFVLLLATGVLLAGGCSVSPTRESATAGRVPAQRPLKALLVTGGPSHDYAHQKDIIKEGLQQRANVTVDILYVDFINDEPKSTFGRYGDPDYAKGYDVVIHDECVSSREKYFPNGIETIQAVLAPHRHGIPGVNLHCGIHSYQIGNPSEAAIAGTERAAWYEYLGIQSSGHGSQQPITLHITNDRHPIMRGMTGWTTENEELYNNVQLFDHITPLVRGTQVVQHPPDGAPARTDDFIVVWTNDYRGTRVFSTTIGHNNETVADPRYLDLVTRGLLWVCGKLGDDGRPIKGYGPVPAR